MKYTLAFAVCVLLFAWFVVGPFVLEFVEGLEKLSKAFGG